MDPDQLASRFPCVFYHEKFYLEVHLDICSELKKQSGNFPNKKIELAGYGLTGSSAIEGLSMSTVGTSI